MQMTGVMDAAIWSALGASLSIATTVITARIDENRERRSWGKRNELALAS